ncbi:hypothetical protein G6F22_018763 [Rhizopus arrhizus]|nr:hypothetical protein G6F22_018763 [Rhizopus arrhizus]
MRRTSSCCAGRRSAAREAARPRTHDRAGTGWVCQLRADSRSRPHQGRQCNADSISMLEKPAPATAMPGDNRRSDPAMQMRLGHKQSAAGYGVRQCAEAAPAAREPARPDARPHARPPARSGPARQRCGCARRRSRPAWHTPRSATCAPAGN